jgi:ubiquinone/menaquinone biosynthesis C-methylase UbiE
MSDNTRNHWNEISPYYQAEHRIPADFVHYGPHCPNEEELQLLGDVRGKRVLEVGCGGGQCSIAFAKRGAIATGVDLSDAQVEFARGLAEREGVEATFLQSNAEDLSGISDASQDVVFSAFAFQFVERMDRCFAEVARVLRPGGLFVFSVDHPFWYCVAESAEMRVEFSYFDSAYSYDWESRDMPTRPRMTEFHRTVGAWYRFLRDAGLEVLDIIEPEPVESGSGEDWGEGYAPERQRLVPATIIWKARRSLNPPTADRDGGLP